MRSRLVYTLSLWLLAAVGTSVLAMAAVSAWNLGQGFSAYLRARDLERLDNFARVVGESLSEAGGLDALAEQRLDMPRLLGELRRQEGFPEDDGASRPGRPEPPPAALEGRRPPPPPPGDDDAFGSRVALFDLTGIRLAGPPLLERDSPLVERPVLVQGKAVALVRMRPVNPIPSALDARFLRSQYQGIAAVAAALILLALASAWWLARRWAAPLVAVAHATSRIARGERNVRLPPAGNDEIGDVVCNVNVMAESLERMEGARRRWIADMSHELRTPLTVLRGEIEALVDGIRPLNRDAAISLREDVLRLGALIDDLHLLAMADLQSLPCHFDTTDAADLVIDAVKAFAGRASAAGLHLTSATPPSKAVPVYWDPARIQQLLYNLLENCLRYTDAPGSVRVTLQQDGENVSLSIDDSGPGVAAADLPRLFEPLYRTDAARGRNSGGSGLGLAICEAIVLAHGGCIKAVSSPLGGLRLEVTLPVDARSVDHVH